ncbi:MAG: fumarylacetoacetate hydrolase family protein [Gemmatales bacterium]|nr:fumarylacetoacetate hydrolase family protein [Gemmatales bacterium]MDW8175535.1 fumarylacetoacetate hydrolase family protein [Gemmatales bacterium]
MQLCKWRETDGKVRIGLVRQGTVQVLKLTDTPDHPALTTILHAENPAQLAESLVEGAQVPRRLEELPLLPPIDYQEVWAAGVTYQRSEEARKRESHDAGLFYDKVYRAPRPELFFKAPAYRVVGPGGCVRIRRDSHWSVPEPELAVVCDPRLRIVGYTIGNDMSARDIEGENPLYLPQAKIYDGCCALGPVITLASAMPSLSEVQINLLIERRGHAVFRGHTSLALMRRSVEELVTWLGKETTFPSGVVLLTGTGIVPPDEFTLEPGDIIDIEITGIGRLKNVVTQER